MTTRVADAAVAGTALMALGVSACKAQVQYGDRPSAAQTVNAFVSDHPDSVIAALHLATRFVVRGGVPEASRDSLLDGLERLSGSVHSHNAPDVVSALMLAGTTWDDKRLVQRLQRIYEASTNVGIKHMVVRMALQTGDTTSALRFLGTVAQRGYEGGAVMAPALAVELLAKSAGPGGRALLSDLVARNRLINPEARLTAAGFVPGGPIK